MSVKSTISGPEVRPTPFPKLMARDDGGVIVLFLREGGGVVVFALPDTGYEVGFCGASWRMECFKDFKGRVTLENP